MSRRVLHILSQRPSLTGSGITLDAMVRCAAAAGWSQRCVVGVPAADPAPAVGELAPAKIEALVFETADLPFPVPGMSDVMPYPSSVFAQLAPEQIENYQAAWRRHLAMVLARWRPDLIHVHHIWLVAALLKDVAPNLPVVNHCHATGLRQMALCPHLLTMVSEGCRRNERFVVLYGEHAGALAAALNIPAERITVVGAGYRDDIFRRSEKPAPAGQLLYIGKLSDVKGLPCLLDAMEFLAARHVPSEGPPELTLHVAGSGAGPEAEALRERMAAMAPLVKYHGPLSQTELAALARQCGVCVLPSFYEGLPLVLVEALACGCRLVATDLPGIVNELQPRLGEALNTVSMPRLATVDEPVSADLPAFVERLSSALAEAVEKPPLATTAFDFDRALASFTWQAVYRRIERVWHGVITTTGPGG